jgi:hypothetical protein
MPSVHRLSSLLLLLVGAAVAGCDDDEPPHGAYPALAACYAHFDCASGFCCTKAPCGGGTCTYPCRSDRDCPYGSLCEGDACFLACRSDADCALGQRCRHDHTVCQY